MERKLIRGEWVVHARLDLIHNVSLVCSNAIKLRRMTRLIAINKRATRQCKARTKFIEARQYMIKQGVWEETVDEVLWKTAIRVRPCCKEALDVLEGVGRCFALEGCERCGEMREVAHVAWGEEAREKPEEPRVTFKPWKAERVQSEVLTRGGEGSSPNFARFVAYPSRFGKTNF